MNLLKRVRANRWHKFQRIFSNQTSETRYIREIIFGKRSSRIYWEITIDPETLSENSTYAYNDESQGEHQKNFR
jgi:SRSO17 transposase